MRKYNQSMHATKNVDHVLTDDLLRKSLSEHDIIILQDTFLTQGLHYMSTSDPASVRPLIVKFLKALDCFESVAFLSMHEFPSSLHTGFTLHEIYFDIIERMADQDFIYDFFFNECQFDFIWIEHAASFPLVIPALIDAQVSQQTPIIIVG